MSVLKKEPVAVISSLLAVVSIFFIPPDVKYFGYIDYKTIFCLFCLMASIKGIENEGFLSFLSDKMAKKIHQKRSLVFLLIFLCFFSSMLMTNDVALIAFVPITLTVLPVYKMEKYSAIIVVLQTLAANIGASLTPIGNPQNLFIFVKYDYNVLSFLTQTLPFVIFGGLLLIAACFLIPNGKLLKEDTINQNGNSLNKNRLIIYFLLFILSISAVFELIPFWIVTPVVIASTFFIDKKTLVKVDYGLLLTFISIFILVGNITRIEDIKSFITNCASVDTFLTAIGASQFISNVPAAVMLSGFTNDAGKLLLGVNVGGLGTLIASMASVISFKLFSSSYPNKKGSYMLIFTVLNIAFLVLTYLFVLMTTTF